jgi:hypothetical protein
MPDSDLKLLKSFRKNTVWFDNNYQSLKKYDGQFIAIHRENVVDSDNDYRKLVDRSLYVTLVARHGNISPAR